MGADDRWHGYTGLDELEGMVVLGANFHDGDGWIKGAEVIDGFRRALLHDASFYLELYDAVNDHHVEILVSRAALNLESRAATPAERVLASAIAEAQQAANEDDPASPSLEAGD
jgi:hypothetical protein